MEQNKNQGRQQEQSNQPGRQQNDRDENVRREEERSRTERPGLTETDEDADAITSEGKQELGKQKPMREWDNSEEGEESESGQRFPKTDQPNNKPNTESGNKQGNQRR